MKHDTSTFLSGCAPFNDLIFFAKEVDELVVDGTPNSSFFCFDERDATDQFRKYDKSVGWPAVAMATIKPVGAIREVVGIGPNGDFWELEPQSTQENTGKISDFQGNLRTLSVIDEIVFACGMGRVVLERKGKDQWKSIGPNPTKDDADVIGFEDIAGYNKAEIYATGWGGEIWMFDNSTWRRMDSPTSINLTAICCASNESVYIVGHSGIMLRGRNDAWSIIDTDRKEDLRDVAFYDGAVYVVTDFRILKLVDDKLVNDTDFADPNDFPETCLHLLVAADGLISMGTKDVFIRKKDFWERLV